MSFFLPPGVNYLEDEDLLKTTQREILYWCRKLGVSPLHLFRLSENELRERFTAIRYIDRCKQQKKTKFSKLRMMISNECRLTGGNEDAIEKIVSLVLKKAAKEISEIFTQKFEVKNHSGKQKDNDTDCSFAKLNNSIHEKNSSHYNGPSHCSCASSVNPTARSTHCADHMYDFSKVMEPKSNDHLVSYFSYPNRESFSQYSTTYDCISPMKAPQIGKGIPVSYDKPCAFRPIPRVTTRKISDAFDFHCSEDNNFNSTKTTSVLFQRPKGGQSDRNDNYQENESYYYGQSNSVSPNSYYNSAPIQNQPRIHYPQNGPYANTPNVNYGGQHLHFTPPNDSRGPSLKYGKSFQHPNYGLEEKYVSSTNDDSEDSDPDNDFNHDSLSSLANSINSTLSDMSINMNTGGILDQYLELTPPTPISAGDIVFNADAYSRLHGRATQFLIKPLQPTEVDPFPEHHQTKETQKYNPLGTAYSQNVSLPIENQLNAPNQYPQQNTSGTMIFNTESTPASSSVSGENPLDMTVKEFFKRYLRQP